MNSKEIKEALKIIKEPITVNCIEYKYFDDENYNKLLKVYENCLWFANNFEQINLTIENLQKENQKLKEQLQQKEYIINKAKEYIENNPLYDIDVYEYSICLNGIDDEQTKKDLLEILDNKGDEK